jgi:hypothetical protein
MESKGNEEYRMHEVIVVIDDERERHKKKLMESPRS